MTSADADPPVRYALLTNGSGFSRAVVKQLLQHDFLPDIVYLPEYPPASVDNDIYHYDTHHAFLSLISGIELAYAPREHQLQAAEHIAQRNIDYILVACWPYLIGTELRSIPRQASLNLHPSILPRYRGANPLQQQITNRDLTGGVTLHLLDADFDHGDIVDQSRFQIEETELALTDLETRCAEKGVEMFIAALQSGQGSWQPVPQANQALDTD